MKRAPSELSPSGFRRGSMCKRTYRMRKLAFTLIELLVVIAIIAILAAILFPVFSRAKESALATRSMAQMKQLGLALVMYASNHDDYYVPCSLRSTDLAAVPVLWPSLLLPYVKNEEVFVTPGTDGAFAGSWSTRFNQSVGYNESTAYDPFGCVPGAFVPPCEGFTSVISFAATEFVASAGLFAVTPNGPGGKYRGYTFNPFNGPNHPTLPHLGLPLISDRDLIQELSHLSAAQLKPIYCRFFRTGKDEGRTPIVFADGHTKSYSAKSLQSFNSGVIFRFRE